MTGPIDFDAINRAALAAFPAVRARILPGGELIGAEIVALNPRRPDLADVSQGEATMLGFEAPGTLHD
jgi:hypothetical protein